MVAHHVVLNPIKIMHLINLLGTTQIKSVCIAPNPLLLDLLMPPFEKMETSFLLMISYMTLPLQIHFYFTSDHGHLNLWNPSHSTIYQYPPIILIPLMYDIIYLKYDMSLLNKTKESTTSSPSHAHMGHYKTSCRVTNVAYMRLIFMKLPVQYGYRTGGSNPSTVCSLKR